jgi:phage gp36-like protein
MAYARQEDLEIAAGGAAGLRELADHDGDGYPDQAVLDQAQNEADGWIDGFARRLFKVPFEPVPDAIRALAAAEGVYRLKQYRRVTTEEDRTLRTEREATMRSIEMGKFNPVDSDEYPIGEGGGTPIVVERTGSSFMDFGRDATKGFW